MTEHLFLDPATNQIFSYPGDGSLDHLVPGNYSAITLAVADAIRNPPPSLDDIKTARKSLLEADYQLVIQQPVSYMGTTFQTDLDSQNTLSKVLVALPGATPPGFYWVDATNAQVPMTFAQLQGLAGAMMTQGWTAFQKLQTLKASINACTTPAAVDNITW